MLADGTRFGLQAAIFTRDLEAAMRSGAGVDAGEVVVNEAEPRLLVLPVPS